MILGFMGDFLTFAGGVLLAIDAVMAERKFKEFRGWVTTIKDPSLAKVILTREGVRLKHEEDVERSFVRQSAKLARSGMITLAAGFLCLFLSRVSEARHQAVESHHVDKPCPIIGK